MTKEHKMIKTILFIIDGLPGGGAEKVVITLAEEMANRGHCVTIASLSPQCDYTLPDKVDYLLVEDTYRGPLRRQMATIRRARQLNTALQKHFGNRTIDLAVSNLPSTDRIVAACPSLRDAWLCLHCAIEAGQLQHKHGVKRWLKQRQLMRTYSQRKLITVCQSLQDDILKCGIRPLRMETIYNPFDIDAILRQAQQPCFMEGESFLLHVGRLHSQKRHDRLLEAFKLSGYTGKLVLLGQGSPQEQQALVLQAEQLKIADRLVFAGFHANPYSVMHAAQALVLSSDYEGFGNVLVEAMICGTPVISTRCPYGPDEILTGNLARGLSEMRADALAESIRRILSDPPQVGPEVMQRFSVANAVDRYLSLADG